MPGSTFQSQQDPLAGLILSPEDMRALGIPEPADVGSTLPTTQAGNSVALAPSRQSPFNWADFAATALMGMRYKPTQVQVPEGSPSIGPGLRTVGSRTQPQPTNVQDFLLPGLMRLFPQNPLLVRR